MIQDPSLTGSSPAFLWFTDDLAGSLSREGARASVFYGDEFYDNVYVRQRGAFTNAQSQKFEFDQDHRFRASDTLGRVKEINLNGEGDDPSFLRQTLAFKPISLPAMSLRIVSGADVCLMAASIESVCSRNRWMRISCVATVWTSKVRCTSSFNAKTTSAAVPRSVTS